LSVRRRRAHGDLDPVCPFEYATLGPRYE
jgi:hypothetical protein